MLDITDYMTVPEAAKKQGVSRQAILHLIDKGKGKLHATRVGRQWLIHKDDLAAYAPDQGGRPPGTGAKSPKASKTRGGKK